MNKESWIGVGVALLIMAGVVTQFQHSYDAQEGISQPPPRHRVFAYPWRGPAKLRWVALENGEARRLFLELPLSADPRQRLPSVGELRAGMRLEVHERVKTEPQPRPIRRKQAEPEASPKDWDGHSLELGIVRIEKSGNEAGLVASFVDQGVAWPETLILRLENTAVENRGWFEAREIARSRGAAMYVLAGGFALLGVCALGIGASGYRR